MDSADAMLGVSSSDLERRERERIAMRQQRLAEGFTQEECDQLEADDEKEFRRKRNLLAQLDGAFEEVRDVTD